MDASDSTTALLRSYETYGSVRSVIPTPTGIPHPSDPNSGDKPHEYVAYSQRWVVLSVFSLLSCMNHWIWITWSPMAPALAKFWAVPTSAVDNLSAVFMYVYIPLSFPALFWLHRYKLRWGLIVGGCLNFLGTLVRYWGVDSYAWVYCGTFLCAMCQTLTLAMPPLISTLWFQETERGLATSLGVLANQLGSAFGLGATIAITFSSADGKVLNKNNLDIYLASQMLLSGLSIILILCLVRSDAPPTPPSAAASLQVKTTYLESVHLLVGSLSGSVLCVIYGLAVGVLYALATFLSQFFLVADEVGNYYWSEKDTGYLGISHIVAGLVGSLLAGEYLDRTKSYRTISGILLLGSFGSMVGFLLCLQFQPWNKVVGYITICLLGFFLTGFVSVGFEYGTAISYPADEAAVAGIMNVAAQLGGWGLVELGGVMDSVGEKLNFILVATLLVACTLLWLFVRAKPSRPTD